MTWQNLEEKVRTIASLRWNCTAVAETIAGVKCDCVLKISDDNWIIVEITEQNKLEKSSCLVAETAPHYAIAFGICKRCFLS